MVRPGQPDPRDWDGHVAEEPAALGRMEREASPSGHKQSNLQTPSSRGGPGPPDPEGPPGCPVGAHNPAWCFCRFAQESAFSGGSLTCESRPCARGAEFPVGRPVSFRIPQAPQRQALWVPHDACCATGRITLWGESPMAQQDAELAWGPTAAGLHPCLT